MSFFITRDFNSYSPYNFSASQVGDTSHPYQRDDMSGGTFKSTMHTVGRVLRDLSKPVMSIGRAIENPMGIVKAVKDSAGLYSSDTGTMVKNRLRNHKDSTSADSYTGENHAMIIHDETGKIGMANFTGPGTHILERERRGDRPVSTLDQVSEAHDLRYVLGKTTDDLRDADHKFIERTRNLLSRKKVGPIEGRTVIAAIEAKMFAEDKKILSKTKVLEDNTKEQFSSSSLDFLQSRLTSLEQKGEGMDAKEAHDTVNKKVEQAEQKKRDEDLPVQRLVEGLVFKKTSSRRPGIGGKKRKTQTGVGRGKGKTKNKGAGLKLAGQGLNLPGGGLSLPGG